MEENIQEVPISFPHPSFDKRKNKQKLFEIFKVFYRTLQEKKKKINFPKLSPNSKKILKYIMTFVAVLLVLVIGTKIIDKIVPTQTSTKVASSSDIKIADPLSLQKINKEFKFPLRDDKGKEVSTFSYTVESAELRKEILIKGQKATTIAGKIFLILNLKIVNTLKQGINVNTRDYIRLSVNGNTKDLLAPDVHNDPAEIQAISTKYTRVGFAINDTDKSLVLYVGEIDKNKELIKLNFK